MSIVFNVPRRAGRGRPLLTKLDRPSRRQPRRERLERAELALASLQSCYLVVDSQARPVGRLADAPPLLHRFRTRSGTHITQTPAWGDWVREQIHDLENRLATPESLLPRRFGLCGGSVVAWVMPDSAPDTFLVVFRYLRALSRSEVLAGRGLTNRETEVASEVLEGATNSDIAGTLGISLRTVQKHVENIFAKLGVHSRAQLFDLTRNWA